MKLVKGREVTHAMFGWKKLTMDQIEQYYGNPPMFELLEWPNKLQDLESTQPYWALMGSDTSCMVPVICQVTDALKFDIDQENGDIYSSLALDLKKAIHDQRVYWDEDDVFDLATYG